MRRKCDLVTGEIYHIFTKSIAGYTIFNRGEDFDRAFQVFRYYQIETPPRKFSDTLRMAKKECILEITGLRSRIVQIIAYCVMPTHLHFVLKQLKENGIEVYMGKILNSYAKYFNALHKRKGPLWEGRFQNVWVETDEQLLHLTRYIHLNPVTAYLVDKPEKWSASSYLEYLEKISSENYLCDFQKLINIKPEIYQKFVENQISYQRELAKIKNLLLE